ncbi:hypothetical protein BC937DRAFT_86844 [Endogone sp. FLAS-F59071]|nr:hypothetical protein BC937DRAFT_86844 [Endogone sp. FLAS-F59071]|eukprot:RUS19830.1 hypothetical protein BC937DRAFT_86844 [Endogone sp. FLAS-F59071]
MKWIYLAIVLTSVLSLVQARPELVLENDSRNLITIGSFGFLAGGKLTLELSHLSLSDRLAQGILAFYIHRSSTVDSAYQDLETADEGSEDDEANDGDVPTCVLDHEIIRNEVQDGTCTILTVPDNQTVWTYEHIVAADEEALWTIVFVNCKHGSDVTLTLKTTELNPGPNHLSAGDSPLPKVYGSVAAAYVVAACIWGWALTRPDTKIFWSHRLMLLLVILVGINKALQALKYHYMKIGVDAEGYTISVYIFAFSDRVGMDVHQAFSFRQGQARHLCCDPITGLQVAFVPKCDHRITNTGYNSCSFFFTLDHR